MTGSGVSNVDGTIQVADQAGDLVVDGETYGCVKSYCYLGDGDGEADFAAIAKIRSGMDDVPGFFSISDIQSSPG